MCEVKHYIPTCRCRPLPSFCTYQPPSQYFIPDFEKCILPENITAIFTFFYFYIFELTNSLNKFFIPQTLCFIRSISSKSLH